jgi:hypothetical protein
MDNKQQCSFESSFYYKHFFDKNKGRIKRINLCMVLYFPYLIITLLDLFFHYDILRNNNMASWLVFIGPSSWFVFGPYLVCRYHSFFIKFKFDSDICDELKQYFQNNEERFYKTYRRNMRIIASIIIFIGVGGIVFYPEVLLSLRLVNGYCDPFFPLIVIYLIWFLIYTANCPAFILLMIQIVREISKGNIFQYNPMKSAHNKSFQKIIKFGNTTVAYTCSALLLLPLAFYFFSQQIAVLWLIILLVFFGIFLFLAITFPKISLKIYIINILKEYLHNERNNYFSGFPKSTQRHVFLNISLQLAYFNSYLRLQELKTVDPLKTSFDSSQMITYLTIITCFLSTIPGIFSVF